VLELLVLPLAAFILALLSVIAIVIVAGAGFNWPSRMFSYLLLLTVSASVATVIFSGRVLSFRDEALMIASEANVGSTITAKLLLVVVIGCSVALCVAWIFNFKNYKTRFDRFLKRGLKAPNDLTLAFMAYYLAFSVLPILFGQRYYFHINLVYPFFTYLALFLWARLSSADPVTVAKQGLYLIVFSSLIAAIIAPQLVMQPGYVGLIPGFDLRLWGMTSHANTLGAVASMLLMLELAEPSAKAWLRMSILAAGGLALVLTQSKTSIAATFVGFLIILGWRLLTRANERNMSGKDRSLIPIGMFGGLFASVAAIGALAVFLDMGILASLENQLGNRAVAELATATHRTTIWNTAIEAGLESPLFGQGAGFWEFENRLRLGLSGATSAHNLFLQTFSRSGLIGLAGLMVFLYFLIQYSMRAAKPTQGGSIAILVVLLMRSMFESNIQFNSVIAGEFFVMAAHFIYVADRGAKPLVEQQFISAAGIPPRYGNR
jgi:O-antigen ligase